MRQETFVLTPSFLWTSWATHREVTGPCAAEVELMRRPRSGTVWVGYVHRYEENALCSAQWNYIYRAAVFDLTPVTRFSRKHVREAVLRFGGTSDDTRVGPGVAPEVGFITCVQDILVAEADPPTVKGLTLGTRIAGGVVGPNRVDVTPTVQRWVAGIDDNFGFVLTGPDESFQAHNSACHSQIRWW